MFTESKNFDKPSYADLRKTVRETLLPLFRREMTDAEWHEIIAAVDTHKVPIKDVHAALLADEHLPAGTTCERFTSHLRRAKERLGGVVHSRSRKAASNGE